jgi:hypothetical protein
MMLPIFKFKAHFTKGLMKGMIMPQDMTFTGEAEAFDWACRVNKNNRNGNCDFWVADLEPNGFKEIDIERV